VKGQEGGRGQSVVGFARSFAAPPAAGCFAAGDSGSSGDGDRTRSYGTHDQRRHNGRYHPGTGLQLRDGHPTCGSCVGQGLRAAGEPEMEERLNVARKSLQIVNIARLESILSRHQVWMGREGRWPRGCTPVWKRWRPPDRFQSRLDTAGASWRYRSMAELRIDLRLRLQGKTGERR